VQAGIGLFTGVMVYSTAFGGLFALAFAIAYGRIGTLSPRSLAVVLAALGFIAVHLVPSLKYPPNPPSVGDPDTIGMRTALYFSLIAVSLVAMIAAGMLRSRLQRRLGAWNACLVAGAAYIVLMAVVGLALPRIDEVPAQFPADVLWHFRIASLGAQVILWTTLGLVFGALIERAAGGAQADRRSSPSGAARAQ
jgi:predicted cobalt transporter CbtA